MSKSPTPITHTPGPWRVIYDVPFDDVTDALGEICVEHPTFDAIEVFMPRWAESNLEHLANTRLIAAAPELLEALKSVMAQFDAGYFVRNVEGDFNPDWAIKAVRAVLTLTVATQAIAKAEGH